MSHKIVLLQDVNRYYRGENEFCGHVGQEEKGLTKLHRLPVQDLSEHLVCYHRLWVSKGERVDSVSYCPWPFFPFPTFPGTFCRTRVPWTPVWECWLTLAFKTLADFSKVYFYPSPTWAFWSSWVYPLSRIRVCLTPVISAWNSHSLLHNVLGLEFSILHCLLWPPQPSFLTWAL